MNIIVELFQFLPRTPEILDAMLKGLPEEALRADEGPDTWSAFDVVGHLLHGERTDWMARLNLILTYGVQRTFEPFDRFAQFKENVGKSAGEILAEFRAERMKNLGELKRLDLQASDLLREGMHPSLGRVTLHNLLSTWCAHDMTHIAQIERVLAKRYRDHVGPWLEYMRLVAGK